MSMTPDEIARGGTPQPTAARLDAETDGAYQLTYATNSPVRLALIGLTPNTYIALGSTTLDGDQTETVYATLERSSPDHWALRLLDIRKPGDAAAMLPVVERHGAKPSSQYIPTEDFQQFFIAGRLTADQLRGLFTDPEFVALTRTELEVRLDRKP
jgi:hypothetical protein